MEYVAISITALALLVSVWSAFQNRAHNRLSVRPRLHLFNSLDANEPRVGVGVRNVGLGPAQILEVRLYFDDAEFQQSEEAWAEVLDQTNFSRGEGWRFGSLFPGALLKQNEICWLLYSDAEAEDWRSDFGNYDAALSRFTIRISYESFYGDRQPQFHHSFLRASV